jgi:hypothetical protein
MVGVLMALIDKTKNYLNVEENNLYTFKHFKFNDVKEAVLEFKKRITEKLDICCGATEYCMYDDINKDGEKTIHKRDFEVIFKEVFGDWEK